tara:strand:- start:691 stop:1344 length:654 start_codon:yes stop_codon:yes gene_type:complete
MKLTDIILKEGVEKRMINFLDDLNHNKRTIDVADFMKEFGLNRDEAVDFIHKWNMSKVDRSVKEESHGDNYEKNNIKLMGDVILPIGKEMVLQAEEDTYNRGLLVTNNKDKSYDVAYWAGKFEPYPIEVEIDGKSVSKDAKKIKLLFHPEMDENVTEAFDELDDGYDQKMEDLIKAGPRLNKDRFEDVIYYIHNNWMAGNYGDDYAIKRISNYLNAR